MVLLHTAGFISFPYKKKQADKSSWCSSSDTEWNKWWWISWHSKKKFYRVSAKKKRTIEAPAWETFKNSNWSISFFSLPLSLIYVQICYRTTSAVFVLTKAIGVQYKQRPCLLAIRGAAYLYRVCLNNDENTNYKRRGKQIHIIGWGLIRRFHNGVLHNPRETSERFFYVCTLKNKLSFLKMNCRPFHLQRDELSK